MFARFCSDTFTTVWNGASVVTLFLPLLAFSSARLRNEYDWEQQQNGENSAWGDYNNPDNYDEYGHYVGPSHWWQFWKNDQEGHNDERRTPWWCKLKTHVGGPLIRPRLVLDDCSDLKTPVHSFRIRQCNIYSTDIWGEQEPHAEDDGGDGTMIFVYIWTLIALGGMIYLGNTTGMAIDKLQTFRLALFAFANSCFITMVLIGGLHVIESEGPDVEEDGWYGQVAVLLLLTTAFGLAQSLLFISWTGKRIKKMNAAVIEEKTDGYVNVEHETPPVQAKPTTDGYVNMVYESNTAQA